jgi:outer membrane protein OmpA-like peptidoglycan-associated protein
LALLLFQPLKHFDHMRNLLLLPLLAFLFSGWKADAQNQTFKNAIHAKLNFIDYGILADNDLKLGQGFEFAYIRNLAPALNLGVPARLSTVKLPGSDENTITAGADLQFRLENLKAESKIAPFAFAGAGYVYEKDNNHVQFPFGAGIHFRLGTYAFLNLQAEFRKALIDERDNLQLGIGYVYMLHKSENQPTPVSLTIMDADKDGVLDSLDLCPELPGPPSAMGCPDADNDGVADDKDECPEDAGTVQTNGCPDYDLDGVADKMDDCPTEAGSLNGCPDTDGDGVADKDDKCPLEYGVVSTKGCPEAPDADKDGVPDAEDLCPEDPGAYKGCPDTDEDGIPDNEDKCPYEAGTADRNGCPAPKDTDGDGVADDVDPCPTVAGTENGCPPAKAQDSDGDGVPDSSDPCPQKAGALNGCPDTDGDGIADKDDKCPNVPGVAANKGCPEEKKMEEKKTEEIKPQREEKPEVKADRQKLATAARAVQFESAKAILKDASYDILDEVVALMRKNSNYSLSISGFTDDVGDDEANFKLSQDRAKACYDYLIFRGIKAERIRYAGFGEARPIASNDTPEGREQNRRVEFELILE